MARLVWPASSYTSRRLPPTCETWRAARGMNVRCPEGDEQPSILSEVYSRWNHRRTVASDSPPPRSEKRIDRSGVAISARALQRHERRLQVRVQGHGTAARLAFTGAVGHVQHVRDLPLRIGHHRPGQRGHCFGAEAGFDGQQAPLNF
jgi:hypothetical protein